MICGKLTNLTVPDQGVFNGKQYQLVFLDIETFVDKKAGYHMGTGGLSMAEYVRDERFDLHGVSIARIGDKPYWFTDSEFKFGAGLENTDWSDVALVGHNLKFDAAVLAWKYGMRPALYIDTLAMARAVLGSTVPSHSLGALAAHYGLPAKGEMKTDGIRELDEAQEAELADYCVHDVWLCREIFRRLAPHFPASQYQPLSWTIKAFVEPKLQINVPLVEKAAIDEQKRRENVFIEIGIPKETFASSAKFATLLTERGYAVPTKKSPRTGKDIPALSKSDEGFLSLVNSSDPILAGLAEARLTAKSTLLETRTMKFASVGATGPWPFDVNFSGAMQTHRYSGGNGGGGNPQNLPRKGPLREAVEAPKGCKLVVGDFAGIEARLVAYLAKETRLTDVYEAGGDVYCDFGSKFFGRTITKANKEERWVSKTAILGLGYNCGWRKFQHMVKIQIGKVISDEEAKKVVNFYREYYGKVPELWRTLDAAIQGMSQNGYYTSKLPMIKFVHEKTVLPSGLEIKFPNLRQVPGEYRPEWVYGGYRAKRKTSEDFKVYGGLLLENIGQGLAGELTKLAIERIEAAGWPVVGQCHDEVIVVAAEDEAEECKYVVEQAMSESPSWMPELKLAAEVGAGRNWSEAKI